MKTLPTLFIIIILLVTGSLYGQIATYTGTGGTSTAVTGYPNEVVSSLFNSGFGSNTACGSGGLSGKTVATTWTSYSTAGPRYYIKITPNAGYQLNVTGFNAGMRVSNTGPTKVRYAYSLDNGVTWVDDGIDHPLSNPGCGSSIASSWGGGALPTGITSTTDGIIVALFPFAPGASTGTFQTNYINITGTITTGCTPPVITTSSSAASVCAGTGVTLTASGAGASGIYTWTPATTLSASTGVSVVATPATTTTYTVTGYSSASCSATTTITVSINNPPTVTPITGSTTVCASGGTLTLSNATTGGTWSITNTALATISSTGVVTGLTAGSDTVNYAVSNTCGTTVVSYPITINPLPSGGAITGPDSVCIGASVVFANPTATPGGTWSSMNTAVATVGGSNIFGATAGSTIISYSVTTACGTAGAAHAIVVNPLPNAGALSGPDSVCYGTTISLTPSVSGGVWNSAAASIATVTSAGIVTGVSATMATTTISYTVSTFSCGSATATRTVTVKPQPFAGIASGTTLCNLSSASLTTSVAGGTWGTTAPGVATVYTGNTVTGLSAGSAIFTYSVTNSCGTATDTALVTVNPLPAAIGGLATICVGVSVSLTNATPGGLWSAANAAIATVNSSGVTTGVSTGTTNITYMLPVTGCYVSAPIDVQFSMPASISVASSASEVCAGTSVDYVAVPVNGGASPILVWSVNNVIIAGGATYSYTPADGDLVRCWMLSSLACAVPDTASASVSMTVHHIGAPAVSVSTGIGDTTCLGLPVTLTPAPVDGGTFPLYSWYLNGSLITTGPIFVYVPDNGDVITVRMTSTAPCLTYDSASATRILSVSPFVNPTVSIGTEPGGVSCEGYPVTFSSSYTNGGTLPSFQWLVNGSPAGTGSSLTYPPANGDVVQVTLTSNFPCLAAPSATAVVSPTVLPITQPIGVVTATPGYIIAPGAYDTFTVNVISGGGIAPTFQWYKNAIPVGDATSTVFITNELHTGDSISCEVTNTDQCSGVSVFDYIHITVGSNVGVNDMNNNTPILHIQPNPSTGNFTICGLADAKEAFISVTDMAGRNVYTGRASVIGGATNAISLPDITAGLYLLNIRTTTTTETLRLEVVK